MAQESAVLLWGNVFCVHVVQNEVLKLALEGTGRVSLMASEEDDEPVSVQSACDRDGSSYVAVFDPLDGSRNIDASIPTGTIFGLYPAATRASRIPSHNAKPFLSSSRKCRSVVGPTSKQWMSSARQHVFDMTSLGN